MLATLAVVDYETLSQRLARLEKQVAEGERHLQMQRLTVENTEREGQSSATERRILRQLELVQAVEVADRDRVRGELQRAKPMIDIPMLFGSTLPGT
jgi:hypothetical protein